jgi:hypothetical protein
MRVIIRISERRLRVPAGSQTSSAYDKLHIQVIVLDHVSADETAARIRNDVEPSFLWRVWIFVDLQANAGELARIELESSTTPPLFTPPATSAWLDPGSSLIV